MFKTYVRSKLEYASSVWNPGYLTDIDLIEKVQRKFTKRIPGLTNLSYSDRLHHLKLDSLELRRLRLDLCMVYKFLHGSVDCDYKQFFTLKSSITRGHRLTLNTKRFNTNLARHSFANRVVNPWNFLTPEVINAQNFSVFRRLLAKIEQTLWKIPPTVIRE